jgi:HAMP domain-containing protein
MDELLSVLTAIDNGDFTRRMSEGQAGVDAQIAEKLNSIIDRLNEVSSEVGRIAREIGVEGRFGCQAEVRPANGSWKDLVSGVNTMAFNLTDQFRDIAQGVTAQANGDFSRRVTVSAAGEVDELKNTLNIMFGQYNQFADEVTRITREIGTEGKFGGQAEVEGVVGDWYYLVQNVNFMASNLTDQVRDIARTTRGVVEGRPSQKVTAYARGETHELKETINQLVDKMGLSN